MGLLEKVKKFFYEEDIDEEDDEIEETIVQKETAKKPAKVHHRERSQKIEPKKEITERELFKTERTFNFPMDMGDEEVISNEKTIEQFENNFEEEEKFIPLRRYNEDVKDRAYAGIRSYAAYEPTQTPVKVEEKKEEKKFKPTPVISPIYGVLDKNYKKEDIMPKVNEKPDIPKKLDYDSVRKKAYKEVYEETKEDQKGIFFNLNEEKEESNEEVKIIYNDVTFEDEEPIEEEIKEDVELEVSDDENTESNLDEIENNDLNIEPEIEKEESNVEDEDDKILSESNEDDLFNLIDNMYNSDEEEEEDEE